MKNNLLYIVVLICFLLIGLGALYYVYQVDDTDVTPVETVREFTVETTEDFSDEGALINQQLEAQGEISDDDSLETIQQELDNTVIFEEDFGDL